MGFDKKWIFECFNDWEAMRGREKKARGEKRRG